MSHRARHSVPVVTLPDGARVPALGLGTWSMGESARHAKDEIAALRGGLDLGMSLIDTAEMYGEGGAEEIVAQAIAGRRDEAFVVSKVYPHNAGRRKAIAACERSLARLRTDRLDLYLLHWRGSVPIAETVEAFETLRHQGKIVRWGVSNFDVGDMDELFATQAGDACATNQVLYHLGERGIEFALLPLLRARRIPVMAYSPLGQGALLANARLRRMAKDLGVTAATLAIAWLLHQEQVIVIPKAVTRAHVEANRAAADLELNKVTLAAIDAAFPPPTHPTPLAMI